MVAIAPAIKVIAERLQHLEYYVLQTLDQGWVMTTLSNRQQPNTRKNIIYAYPTLADAAKGPQSVKDPVDGPAHSSWRFRHRSLTFCFRCWR
jgi:hypothetical protein